MTQSDLVRPENEWEMRVGGVRGDHSGIVHTHSSLYATMSTVLTTNYSLDHPGGHDFTILFVLNIICVSIIRSRVGSIIVRDFLDPRT